MKPTTVMTIKGAKACFKAGAMLGRSTCREAAKTILVLMDLLTAKCDCWRTAGECSNCQKKLEVVQAMKQDKLSQVVAPLPLALDQATLAHIQQADITCLAGPCGAEREFSPIVVDHQVQFTSESQS